MANEGVDILGLPTTVGGLSGTEWSPLVQGGTTKRTQVNTLVQSALSNLFPAGIEYEINGGGSIITTGVAGSGATVPFNCTITSVTLTGVGTGSVVVDIWRTTPALYNGGATHPAVGDSITGTAKPTIVAGSFYTDSILPGWSIILNAGDLLWYNVQSVATFTSVTVTLATKRTFT